MLSKKLLPLPRPPTTESLSSSSATPSSEREWKKPKEPTLPTEKLVSHTLTEPRRTLASPKVRSGTSLRELVTSSRTSKPRTRPLTTIGNPPTPHGLKPTLTLPSNWKTPKPPVFLETRSSKKFPDLFLTTFLDLPIFTDLPVTTSTKEETSELVSTRPTEERTCTS